MCNFCNNIPILEKYKKIYPSYDRIDAIVYSFHSKKYGYWYECEDSYYSGVIKWIYYCPMCGRKLK